jgi:hypothetical protein
MATRDQVSVDKVRGVVIAVECDYCHGKRRLPGGKYKDQGEVVDCPVCNGVGAEKTMVTLAEFKRILAS